MDEIYYKLIQDDDCHWYVIPAELEGKFNEWVEYHMNGNWESLETFLYDFNEYRIDGPHRIIFKEWSEI